jgi:hypothetical protein
MSLPLLLVAATASLAVNYRWALLDPHAPRLGPSWRSAVSTALWVAVLFTCALALNEGGYERAAALASSFAFGTAISPSIAPPYTLTAAEEPRVWRRLFKSRLHSLRILSIKMLLIVPVSVLLGLVLVRHPSFYASATVSLVFSGVKAAYLVDLLRGPPATPADIEVRRALTLAGVLRSCAIGSAALLVWFALIFPVVDRFPDPEIDDYAMLTAFVFGLLLRPN